MKLAGSDFEVACRTEPSAAVARAGLAAAQLRLHLLTRDPALLARSEATAREAVGLDSSRAEPHRILAGALAIERNQPEALAEYSRAYRLDPTDDDAALKMARTYARMGDPAKEKQAYLAIIAQHPHWWKPYWWLGACDFRQGNVRELATVLEQDSAFAEGASDLGRLRLARGEYSGAIQEFRRALELNPHYPDLHFNLATAYFNSGRLAEAVDAYNQSFQFGTAGYESWLNLGDAYFWLRNRRAEATDAYAQAVRLGREEITDRTHDGRTPDVMISANLATIFPKLGQPDSARLYIARAVAADSANPRVHYCAALTYWQLNRKEVAIASLEKSVHEGYPVTWLRDSPIFQEWRAVPAFVTLVGEAKPRP